MTLKTRFLVAADALTLPAIAAAQTPAPPPSAPPAATQPPHPGTMPPAPSSATTPPTQQPTDATETEAQQPDNNAAAAQPVQQAAQTPPPATTPAATPQPAPATGAQAQASPPAATTPAATGAVRAAIATDLRTGVQVRDQQGGLVGTVETADAASAVVNTGTARGRLALTSFGVNSQGLVIAMTKAQLEAAVAAARPG